MYYEFGPIRATKIKDDKMINPVNKMMGSYHVKIKKKANWYAIWPSEAVHECPEEVGKRLVAEGYAVKVESPKKVAPRKRKPKTVKPSQTKKA